MTARSHHEAGKLFGTDGHVTWIEPGLFDDDVRAELERLVDEIQHPAAEVVHVSPVCQTHSPWWCRCLL